MPHLIDGRLQIGREGFDTIKRKSMIEENLAIFRRSQDCLVKNICVQNRLYVKKSIECIKVYFIWQS